MGIVIKWANWTSWHNTLILKFVEYHSSIARHVANWEATLLLHQDFTFLVIERVCRLIQIMALLDSCHRIHHAVSFNNNNGYCQHTFSNAMCICFQNHSRPGSITSTKSTKYLQPSLVAQPLG